ncbi:TatD family hydrolase [Frigoriglobus tundricola]|uniref:Putative metal-dependent hydrolase YcfH n=1 Tax=Frigoriglobus tundricola TaxID=2774151 RepID=A0A6M5Z2V0_9BACT|nr:TatD family hydrolase [Frigoriglobus tundricola]QJW99761.1 putative metal-dependent hydrolase YcfH [Frigoriglobus tundricola]
MPLIDTHTHLFDERFAQDLPAVLDRAAAAGVERVVCLGIDLESSRAAVAIANTHPLAVAAVGIQPNSAAEAAPGDWEQVVTLAEREPRVVAIGETGLDRYWDKTPFALQEDYFARHIELARRLNKPFVIHCREAEADVVKALRAHSARGPLRAVMHSFSGDLATARECLAMGLYISFAGMVTYPNAQSLRDVAKEVPLDRLLVETDCPYLAPQPVRGKRNEPAYVAHTAARLAQVKDVSVVVIEEHTTRNAKALFGL